MIASAPVRLALALGLAALGAMWMLVPDMAERLAMLARDKSFERALRAGDEAVRAGASDPAMLARLFDINSHEGDPASAHQALLGYIHQRPDDRAMLWRAVEFMEESEDLEGLKDVLGMLARRLRDPAAIEQLARLHRLYGDFSAERALLDEGDPAALPAPLRWRLAALLAGEGASDRAAALLGPLDDARPAADPGERTLVFDTLLAAGRAGEAAERAARWTASRLDPAQRSLFVLQLALAGHDGEAQRLAEAEGPDRFDASGLAWTLGTQGHLALAERILDRRIAADTDPVSTRRLLGLYTDLALRTGSTGRVLARTAALLGAAEPAERRRGVALTAILFERQGYGAIAPLRPRLTGALLGEAPLFGASLLLAERNGAAARHFLLLADLARLDAPDARLFAQMSFELLGPAATLDVLVAHREAGTLGPNLFPTLGEAARRAGRFDPAWQILRAEPGGGSPPPPPPSAAKGPSA